MGSPLIYLFMVLVLSIGEGHGTCSGQPGLNTSFQTCNQFVTSECPGQNRYCSSTSTRAIVHCCDAAVGPFQSCSEFCQRCFLNPKCFEIDLCEEYCAKCIGVCTCTSFSKTCIAKNGSDRRIPFGLSGMFLLLGLSFIA